MNAFSNFDLFPARAGMNRIATMTDDLARTVPRTRGDEPALQRKRSTGWACSPHARG